MVRHAGISHRSQIDRVEASQLLQAIRWHHLPNFEIGAAAPIKMLPGIRDSVAATGRLQNAEPFSDHFLSDAVPFNDGDLVMAHGVSGNLERVRIRGMFGVFSADEAW